MSNTQTTHSQIATNIATASLRDEAPQEHGGKGGLSLVEILEREFTGKPFTHFAVMTWHHEGDIHAWKADFAHMREEGQIVTVGNGSLSPIYAYAGTEGTNGCTDLSVAWNCCTDGKQPDLSLYDAFELAWVAEIEDGDWKHCERVEDQSEAQFISLFGHFKAGGCECLHDFPEGFLNAGVAKAAAVRLSKITGLPLYEYL